jgi:acyl-CoA synthetase (AMP-forming)/AMP-acid ligase II
MSHRSMPAPDFDGQSLPGLLRDLAARHAHQRAFTFMDYPDLSSTGRSRTLTWAQLQDRARAVAGQLRETARPGDRAVLLMPQGLDYVAGFLGCLIAGVIAVPLFPPDQPGHENRVAAVIEDCEPACALVTEAGAAAAREYLEATGAHRVPLVQIDAAHAPSPNAELVWEDPAPDDIAYLQYTSGSTRTPAGVMITHRNAVVNARQGLTALGALDESTTTVSWLPLFHDMGLVMSVVSPLVAGFPSVLMDPVAFLARPERWLRLLGAYPNVLSAAPNFAYDYCASKVRPGAIEDLRLDEVRALINGAEPVRPRTVHAFATAFAANGLRPEVICPSYGLAEATVFVASDGPDAPPREIACDRAALAEGRIVLTPDPTPTDNRPTGSAAPNHSGAAAGAEVSAADGWHGCRSRRDW